MWEHEHALPEVIANAWHDEGSKADLGEVNVALGKVMEVLHALGSRKFGNVTRELQRLLHVKLAKLYEENASMQ
jgi:hypothetical protein